MARAFHCGMAGKNSVPKQQPQRLGTAFSRAEADGRLRHVCAVGAPDPTFTTAPGLTGKGKVEKFLYNYPKGQSLIMDLSQSQGNELGAYVDQMISENPTVTPGTAAIEGRTAVHGTWKVFWAPHISAMSKTMLTRFEPILYRFNKDGSIASHVKWSLPVLGTGWLSASGLMKRKSDDAVEVSFDRFWIDMGENNLREVLPDEESVTTKMMGVDIKMDQIIGTTGRAFFFPALSIFPVLYLDDDYAVFKFPPLNSKIAIVKLADDSEELPKPGAAPVTAPPPAI